LSSAVGDVEKKFDETGGSSVADEMSKCFDDDFAHFPLPTSNISGRESAISEQGPMF
jgi:hypothetical protein